MDKINERMYQANIELVDRNKLLEEDLKKAQKRIDKAIEIYENKDKIEYKKKRFIEDKYTSDLMYEILKGEEYGDNG